MEKKLVVDLELKSNVRDESNQEWKSEMSDGAKLSVLIDGTKCKIIIFHNTEERATELFYTVWELLVWYDGYFYKPIRYYINGRRRKTCELFRRNMYSTDFKWINSALLIGRNKRCFSEEIINKYSVERSKGRKDKSMNCSMFSAYFNIISNAYKDINIEHRLMILMDICDGFAIQFLGGSKKNDGGNINKVLNKLDRSKYVHGAKLLGIESKKKAGDALGATRTELTHYDYKENSFGSYISDPDYETDNMINLYVFYVLDLALRTAVLEMIGFEVDDEVKDYLLDENLDWIRLSKNIGEDCVIPRNRLEQVLRKFQNNKME